MYACISMGDYGRLGACSPRKIGCSEIAPEAIMSTYMACIVLHPVFACHIWTFAKPAHIEFPGDKVLWLAEQQVGEGKW